MTDEHDVRFTGGPFSWRKGRRGTTIRMQDSTRYLKVIGKVLGLKGSFRSPDEFLGYMRDNPEASYSEGTYERVAPDRFIWRGWDQ